MTAVFLANMSNQNQNPNQQDPNRQPTAQEVEEQKKLAQRDQQAAIQAQATGAPDPNQQQQQAEQQQQTGEGVTKVTIKTEFLNIVITDPNILAELNTPDKYAQNIPFKGVEININPNGGRVVLNTEDKKEVLRAAMSGVKRTTTQEIKHFEVERGPNAPMPQQQNQ